MSMSEVFTAAQEANSLHGHVERMEHMSLDVWDAKVRPFLERISGGADIVARNSDRLMAMPDFETLAENDLAKAEASLITALLKIKHARAVLEHKPRTS
jgi:hypothetical protein